MLYVTAKFFDSVCCQCSGFNSFVKFESMDPYFCS